VPLSDRERKLLAEMEQALSADDPRLSSTLTGSRTFPGRNRVLIGSGALISGLAIILGGLVSQTVPVGIFGFLIALTGLITVLSALAGIGKSPRIAKEKKSSGIRSRLEQRWDDRNFDN
jgi:Protein of unknown function (DUF3040)